MAPRCDSNHGGSRNGPALIRHGARRLDGLRIPNAHLRGDAQLFKGENERLKLHFITEGVESTIAQAKDAARGKNVTVVGGVDLIRQLLEKRLVDELAVGIVPVFLGGGLRLFDRMNELRIKLERARVVESPTRTDLLFQIVR